jgi:enoyl-CoA hydratase/carnithine racemase
VSANDRTAVRYDRVDGVAWLTISRPEARNALNREVRAGLWEGVRRFNGDEEARVLILTGEGEVAFCAGGDLKEMAETGLEVPPRDFVPHFGRNVDVAKPTIAAVNGVAYAGGFLLAQMCDLCVAADHARFAITEARVGRGAPWAAALPWLIPPRVALQILMTGEPISAERAYQVGLVNEVVGLADLRETAQRLALIMAGNAPLSVRAAKSMVYEAAGAGAGRTAAFDAADRIWEPVYLSEDAQEGPRAFAARRSPIWKGR